MTDAIVERGKVVSLTYSLRDQDGELFEYREVPVDYIHGSGSGLFPRIEQALTGRRVGDKVSVELSPADGFGDHDPTLIFTDDLENVPQEYQRIGAEVEMRSDRGESRLFYVTSIDNGKLTVDGNHPLAGQTVHFEVTVTAIRDASEREVRRGRPDGPPPGSLIRLQ